MRLSKLNDSMSKGVKQRKKSRCLLCLHELGNSLEERSVELGKAVMMGRAPVGG